MSSNKPSRGVIRAITNLLRRFVFGTEKLVILGENEVDELEPVQKRRFQLNRLEDGLDHAVAVSEFYKERERMLKEMPELEKYLPALEVVTETQQVVEDQK